MNWVCRRCHADVEDLSRSEFCPGPFPDGDKVVFDRNRPTHSWSARSSATGSVYRTPHRPVPLEHIVENHDHRIHTLEEEEARMKGMIRELTRASTSTRGALFLIGIFLSVNVVVLVAMIAISAGMRH